MRYKNKFMLFMTLLTFLVLSLSSSSISAATFNNNEGSSVIHNAITSGSDNEIVLEGNFNNLSEINLTRGLTIRGGNVNTIQGSGSGTLFNIQSSNVVFINLTISGYSSAMRDAYNSYSTTPLDNVTITGNTIITSAYSIELHSDRTLSNINISNNKIISNSNGIHLNAGRSISNGNNENITIVNNDINASSESIHLSTEFGQNINVNIINNTIRSTGGQSVYLGSGRWDKNGTNLNININNNYINYINGPGIQLNLFNGTNKNTVINNNVISFREGIFAGYGTSEDIKISNNNIISLNSSEISISAANIFMTNITSNITNLFIHNNTINSVLNGIYMISTGKQSKINISRNKIRKQ